MWLAILCLHWLTGFGPYTPRSEDHQGLPQVSVPELLVNPTFKAEAGGWALRHAEYSPEFGHAASGAAILKGDHGQDKWSHVGVARANPPTERKLSFTCWLRCDDAPVSVQINAFGYDKAEDLGDWSETVQLVDSEWHQVETSYVLDVNTSQLTLWVINSSARDVLVSDAHLLVGEAAEAKLTALRGAGVVRASAATCVRTGPEGKGGWVTFPIPNAYRGQIPLSFDLKVDPPEALKDFHWKKRADGVNVLCEAHIVPLGKRAAVRWESLVYLPGDERLDLPRAKEPVVPDEAKKWTKSTACVQSADPDIAAKANELAKDTSDVQAFVENVIGFTAGNSGKPGVEFNSLDARKALDCGGSCTSRANLAAALLRAHGIPARTVAHLPTWADKLYEHWLVEYWHPGVGWVWIEPTRAEMQPRPCTVAVINMANPEDEDRGFDESIAHSGVGLGVPDLSVHKHSPELLNGWDDSELVAAGGNWAHPVLRIEAAPVRTQAFAAKARDAYAKLFADCQAGRLDHDRTARIEAALKTKNIDELERALVH